MPRRLLLALITLVAAPLVLLGWVSATSLRDQRDAAERQVQGLLRSRLVEIDDSLAKIFDDYVRRLAAEWDSPGNLPDLLRELELNDPLVRKGILVSDNGVLVYPPKPVADDPDGIALYAALSGMISSRPHAAGADESAKAPTSGRPHWQVWYMDEGSQLVLWQPHSSGQSIGILLERVRWIADLTAALPDTATRSGESESTTDRTSR